MTVRVSTPWPLAFVTALIAGCSAEWEHVAPGVEYVALRYSPSHDRLGVMSDDGLRVFELDGTEVPTDPGDPLGTYGRFASSERGWVLARALDDATEVEMVGPRGETLERWALPTPDPALARPAGVAAVGPGWALCRDGPSSEISRPEVWVREDDEPLEVGAQLVDALAAHTSDPLQTRWECLGISGESDAYRVALRGYDYSQGSTVERGVCAMLDADGALRSTENGACDDAWIEDEGGGRYRATRQRSRAFVERIDGDAPWTVELAFEYTMSSVELLPAEDGVWAIGHAVYAGSRADLESGYRRYVARIDSGGEVLRERVVSNPGADVDERHLDSLRVGDQIIMLGQRSGAEVAGLLMSFPARPR